MKGKTECHILSVSACSSTYASHTKDGGVKMKQQKQQGLMPLLLQLEPHFQEEIETLSDKEPKW